MKFKKPPMAVMYLLALPFVIRLAVIYSTNNPQFWHEAPFLIASIAAVFAGISALLTLRSLEKTGEALEFTRNTVRPFLALQPGMMQGRRVGNTFTQRFEVKNSGSIPANLVNAGIAFFYEDEKVTEDNRSKSYPTEIEKLPNLIIFPNAVYGANCRINLLSQIGKKLFKDIKNGKVKFRLHIVYEAQGKEYITIQTEKMERTEDETIFQRSPVLPQRWT